MKMDEILQKSVRLIPWRFRTKIKRLPGVAWLQRQALAHVLEGREFLHTIDAGPASGLVFPILLPEDKGIWTGTYELEFIESLSALISPGDVCFDIGGWRGYIGAVMALHGASRVVVFEPSPPNCDKIRRVIRLNANLPIELQPVAVGSANGDATFNVMDSSTMGKLSDSPFQAEQPPEGTINVRVVSLDEWCVAEGVYPDIIKLDVEGAEMMVLEGATMIIDTRRPALFIEAHSRELAAAAAGFLTSINYSVTTLETGRAPDGHSEPEVCHLACVSASPRP
jgi:FkbM family methyltransferase